MSILLFFQGNGEGALRYDICIQKSMSVIVRLQLTLATRSWAVSLVAAAAVAIVKPTTKSLASFPVDFGVLFLGFSICSACVHFGSWEIRTVCLAVSARLIWFRFARVCSSNSRSLHRCSAKGSWLMARTLMIKLTNAWSKMDPVDCGE